MLCRLTATRVLRLPCFFPSRSTCTVRRILIRSLYSLICSNPADQTVLVKRPVGNCMHMCLHTASALVAFRVYSTHHFHTGTSNPLPPPLPPTLCCSIPALPLLLHRGGAGYPARGTTAAPQCGPGANPSWL